MWAIFYVKWGGQKSLYALWELNKTWAKRLSEPKYVHIPYTLEGMVARLGWDLIWMFPFTLNISVNISSILRIFWEIDLSPLTYIYIYKCSFMFMELFLNIIIHCDGVGGSPKDISWISHKVWGPKHVKIWYQY